MHACGMIPSMVSYPLEVGFDAAWEQIRRETAAVRLPDSCNRCPKREVCSVCAAVCVTETGAFDRVPEYVCRMTEETIRLTCEMCADKGDGNK